MKTCVIVVDAWEKCLFEDTNKFPFGSRNAMPLQHFYKYNYVKLKINFPIIYTIYLGVL